MREETYPDRFQQTAEAEARTSDEAGTKAQEFASKQLGVLAEVAQVSLALRQNRKRYCYPEEIL